MVQYGFRTVEDGSLRRRGEAALSRFDAGVGVVTGAGGAEMAGLGVELLRCGRFVAAAAEGAECGIGRYWAGKF